MTLNSVISPPCRIDEASAVALPLTDIAPTFSAARAGDKAGQPPGSFAKAETYLFSASILPGGVFSRQYIFEARSEQVHDAG